MPPEFWVKSFPDFKGKVFEEYPSRNSKKIPPRFWGNSVLDFEKNRSRISKVVLQGFQIECSHDMEGHLPRIRREILPRFAGKSSLYFEGNTPRISREIYPVFWFESSLDFEVILFKILEINLGFRRKPQFWRKFLHDSDENPYRIPKKIHPEL